MEPAVELIEKLCKATDNKTSMPMSSSIYVAVRVNTVYTEAEFNKKTIDECLCAENGKLVFKELLHLKQLLVDAIGKIPEGADFQKLQSVKAVQEFRDKFEMQRVSVSTQIGEECLANLRHNINMMKDCVKGQPRDHEGDNTWLDDFAGSTCEEIPEHADNTILQSDANKLQGFIKAVEQAAGVLCLAPAFLRQQWLSIICFCSPALPFPTAQRVFSAPAKAKSHRAGDFS